MCGIAAAIDVSNAAVVVAEMLRSLQHRGNDGVGIVSAETGQEHKPSQLHTVRRRGRVGSALESLPWSHALPGTASVGHNRYATTSEAGDDRSSQPFVRQLNGHQVVLAHNGNLPNYLQERDRLNREGAVWASDSDTELLIQYMVRARGQLHERILAGLAAAGPAWAVVGMVNATHPWLFAGRDAYGFRPLCYAPYRTGYVLASEPCAFNRLDIDPSTVVHIKPGEVVLFRYGRPFHQQLVPPATAGRYCSFETVYFSMPQSQSAPGGSIGAARLKMGQILAQEDQWRGSLPEADLVLAVPDSGNLHAAGYAAGYADGIGLKTVPAIIRHHGSGRTFIEPTDDDRQQAARAKFAIVASLVNGKRVVVVDDSLVRGTVMRNLALLLRQAGAREVHVRIASPPVKAPCRWGISMRTRIELIANQHPQTDIARVLGVDSLEHLSVRGLRQALGDLAGCAHCLSCFTDLEPY